MGRVWESPPGNFYGSIALRGDVSPVRYSEYSFLMALVLRDTIAEFVAAQISLKWPNDVMLDDRKCAGVLIESDGIENEFLIIGMGVNLYHAPEYAAALWPREAANAARREAFTQRLAESFDHWHDFYLAEGFGTVRDVWLQHAHALGLQITVKMPGSETTGIFEGIDEIGSLLLTQGGETIKVRTADAVV